MDTFLPDFMRYSTLCAGCILTTSLLFASAAWAQGERPAYLRVGLGRTEAAPMYYCARFSVEYQPLLGQHWGVAGRLAGVAGKPTQGLEGQAPNQNHKAGYVEAEALWYPFGNKRRVTFALGAGGFVGYYQYNTYAFLSGISGQLVDHELKSYSGSHAGVLGSLNVEVGLGNTQRWRLGIKSLAQSGQGGITSYKSHSLTLARRL